MSYIVGFGTDSIASFLYYRTACRIYGSPRRVSGISINLAEQRALIREFSPANFQFIHNWKVLKTMSHNLSFSCLILLIPIVKKTLLMVSLEQKIFLVLGGLLSVMMSWIFMHRAHTFDTWHYQDLIAVIKALNLEEKYLESNNIDNRL